MTPIIGITKWYEGICGNSWSILERYRYPVWHYFDANGVALLQLNPEISCYIPVAVRINRHRVAINMHN